MKTKQQSDFRVLCSDIYGLSDIADAAALAQIFMNIGQFHGNSNQEFYSLEFTNLEVKPIPELDNKTKIDGIIYSVKQDNNVYVYEIQLFDSKDVSFEKIHSLMKQSLIKSNQSNNKIVN